MNTRDSSGDLECYPVGTTDDDIISKCWKEMSPEREKSRKFIPVCSNLIEYLQRLRDTEVYKNIVKKRLLDGQSKRNRNLRCWEVAQVFEEQEDFKQLFWDFESILHLGYDPARFSLGFQRAFEEYKVKVITLGRVPKISLDDVRAADLERSEYHNKAAAVLVKDGLVCSEFLGRMVVRALLLDIGMDSISSARQGDLARQAKWLDRSAAEGFVKDRMKPVLDLADTRFSSSEASMIQVSYLADHPSAVMVERDRYEKKPNFMRDEFTKLTGD